MKKIIVLFVLLLGTLISIAQPVTQRGTTSVTVQDARLFAEFNFRPPAFPDTTKANQQIGLDSCGALIYSRDINAYYYRACSPKRWVRVASGGSTADSAYLSYRPLTDSTFLLCRVGGTRCDTIKVNGKGVSSAWIVGGNINPSPPNLGTISTTDVNVITNNVARMKIAGNGINRSAAARNKYLMIDTLTRYLYYGDNSDTSYTSSHKINDTTFSLCRNNGKCDTITIGNNVVNNFINNSQTRLISGSAVWDSLMIYSVTKCFYYINGILYFSLPTNVTLAAADSSNPRIDVIYCDTLGNVGVITGIPSPDPVKPVVNPLSQIELTHININAQGRTPSGVGQRIIYNENVGIPNEWNTSFTPSTIGINFNYPTNPYVGVKSAFVPAYELPNSISFTNDAIVNADTISALSMYLRLNSAVPVTYIKDALGNITEAPLFTISLFKSGVAVTDRLNVVNQNYGYDRLKELSYQQLAIPLSDFLFKNSADKTFDQITFGFAIASQPKLGTQFDYIKFTSGGNPPPVTSNFWSLDGNDNSTSPNAKLGTTSNDQLSIVTNDLERINIARNGVISIPQLQTATDTSVYKPLAINPLNGQVANVTNWGNNIVYTENPIMSKVSNDSNIIYFNPDTANAWRGGGSGTIPTLQQVTTAGATTTDKITIGNSLELEDESSFPVVTPLRYTDYFGGIFSIQKDNNVFCQSPTISYTAPSGFGCLIDTPLLITAQRGGTNSPPAFNINASGDFINMQTVGLEKSLSITTDNLIAKEDNSRSTTLLFNHTNSNNIIYDFPDYFTGTKYILNVIHNPNTLLDYNVSNLGQLDLPFGSVNSVATGYGLSGGTITTSGTLTADTSISGLSGKYLRISDTASALSKYVPFNGSTQSVNLGSSLFADQNITSKNGLYISDATIGTSVSITTGINGGNITLSKTSISAGSNINVNNVTAGRIFNLPDSSGTAALKEYTIDSLKRSSDSVYARKNGVWKFQFKDSTGGGTGFVPYTGATTDVDLGTHILNAQSLAAKGTNGNGHLDLRHQASDAPATGQTTALFADANGDLKWKNAVNFYTTLKTSANTADRVYTFPNATTTLIGASDTATMLSPYLRKVDTASLSNRINLKVNISDTATMLSKYLRKSDTAAMLSPYQQKYIAANTIMGNNTAAAANASPIYYKDTAGTYTGTITWTGTTAPTTTTISNYQWTQTGKWVTLHIHIYYTNAGTALTSVTLTMPSDCPAPDLSNYTQGANAVYYNGIGGLGVSSTVTTFTTSSAYLRRNAGNTANEIFIASSSANYRRIEYQMTYRAL